MTDDNYHNTLQVLNQKYIKNNLKNFWVEIFCFDVTFLIAVVSVFNHCALFFTDRFHSISDCKQMEERKVRKGKESLSNE